MSHVFISYSHEDADFITKLDEICQDEHINTWVDKKRLKAGENWREAIDDGIKNSFALIVVLSPHAVVSPYVTYEWSFALGIGLEIIPVICRQIKFDDNAQKNREIDSQLTSELENLNHRYHIKIPKPEIHPRLNVFQYIDLSNEDDNSQKWQTLITLIKEKQQNFRPQTVNVPREAPQIVHDMVAKFDSEDEKQRKNAIDSLSHMESNFAEEALVSALKHPIPDVRQWSAEKLGQKRSKKAIPELIHCVESNNDDVKRFAVIALIRIGGDEVVPGLIKVLKDKDREIVKKAIKALGDIGHSSAINYLIQIEDNDYQVLQTLYQALGQIGSEQAMPYLIEQLDKNPHFTAIIKSLGQIGGMDGIPHLIKRLEYADNNTRQTAFEALVHIGEKAVPNLIEGLQHQQIGVRNEIVEILVEIGNNPVPNLIEALQHQSGYVRRHSMEVLRKLNTPEAQEALKRIRG